MESWKLRSNRASAARLLSCNDNPERLTLWDFKASTRVQSLVSCHCTFYSPLCDIHMQTVLLTLIGPTRRVDLKLPAEVPIGAMLPKLLELCGPGDAGSPHASNNGLSQWRLISPTKQAALPPTYSLLACGVVDGAVLLLQNAASFVVQQQQAQDPAFRPQALPPSANTGGIGVKWNLPGR